MLKKWAITIIKGDIVKGWTPNVNPASSSWASKLLTNAW